jgi:hypothetical protein
MQDQSYHTAQAAVKPCPDCEGRGEYSVMMRHDCGADGHAFCGGEALELVTCSCWRPAVTFAPDAPLDSEINF